VYVKQDHVICRGTNVYGQILFIKQKMIFKVMIRKYISSSPIQIVGFSVRGSWSLIISNICTHVYTYMCN
jgi:hypothetical protein